MLPPQIPNRYDTDEQRMKRLEAQERGERRKWWLVFGLGCFLLIAYFPLALVGWDGLMLLLAPLGLGMIIGAGVQLFLERGAE